MPSSRSEWSMWGWQWCLLLLNFRDEHAFEGVHNIISQGLQTDEKRTYFRGLGFLLLSFFPMILTFSTQPCIRKALAKDLIYLLDLMLALGRNSDFLFPFWTVEVPALRSWWLRSVSDTPQLCNSLLNSQCCCCGLKLRRGWRLIMTQCFVGGTEYCSPCASVCAELGILRGWEWGRSKPRYVPCLVIPGQSPLAAVKQQVSFKALLTCCNEHTRFLWRQREAGLGLWKGSSNCNSSHWV